MQVPTLSNQVRLAEAPNVQQRPLRSTALEDVGAGLKDVGNVVLEVQRQERAKADQAAFMEQDRNLDTVSNSLFAEAQGKQFKDAIGITPKALEQFDKRATEGESALKGEKAKIAYRQSVNNRRSQLERQIGNHEGQQTQAFYARERESYKDQAHVNAVTYFQDPARIESEIDKIRATVDQTPGVSPEERATELGIRRSGVYAGVVERYLANDDIRGADAYYKSVKDRVNGDKAARIENAITDAKRIAENRARALADHRDAIADRALNEIDRQIASGVPATLAMWDGWQAKVRGTPAETEFKSRMADEAEVQEVLRKPVSEQMSFVQSRQQELDSEGGNLRQVANFQRLAGAVKKNVTMLQTDPLLYQAARLGADVPPLDIRQISDGDPGALAEQMTDRAATLAAMRKQYGTQVPQKLLLPQEAAQLSSAINAAPADRAAGMFGALRNSIGDDKLYAATVQQLAPDNPVKALAGLLAARERTATLATHWFKPNDTIDSQKVASTILQGQDIIAPPKDDKAANGSPKLKLYLPEENSLQREFQAKVGTAFADRPDAAQTAYQAVKAYYVGKAAANGRMAADGQDIDARILSEAVKGILGNVVDVNNRGEVLAPWGMDEGDFINTARAAFTSQADRIDWRGTPPVAFDKLGLRPAGSDSYYVTAGRSFLQGKDGKPLTLTVGQP